EHAVVVERIEEPCLALDPLALARKTGGDRLQRATADRLDPIAGAGEGAARRVAAKPLGQHLGPAAAGDHPSAERAREPVLVLIQRLKPFLDAALGTLERVVVLERAKVRARLADLAEDPVEGVPAHIEQRAPDVFQILQYLL